MVGVGVVMCACMRECVSTSVYLPATTTGLILTNCSRHVSADTPPPAYMPPDEQMGQESQSMDTSSNLVAPNMARGGESCTLPASPSQGGPQYIKTKPKKKYQEVRFYLTSVRVVVFIKGPLCNIWLDL